MVDLQVQQRRYEFMQNEVGNFRGAERNAFTVEYEFYNPKAGAHLRLPLSPGGSTLGFYGFVGRNHLEPSLYDLYDTWLGPEILGVPPLFETPRPVYESDGQTVAYVDWRDPVVQPEEVTDYELGASFRSRNVAVTLNGYFMDVRNEIVPFGGLYLGYGIKGNAPQTTHKGIELDLRAKLGRRHDLQIVAARSWDRYEEFIFFENVYDENWNLIDTVPRDYAGNPIALFPEYLATITWRTDTGAGDTFLRWRTVGRQFLDNSNNEERTIAPFQILDIGGSFDFGRLGWQGGEGARLRLQLRNVLDARYETNGYYIAGLGNHLIPGAARNYWVALEYDF
jgi:outer membrane receptor protein involved in Fe transport